MALDTLKNRYQIIWPLESGTLDETFLAEDTQGKPARQCTIVQLKPLAKHLPNYQLTKQKFYQEAANLQSLGEDINQIPRIYNYFELNECFYLVQEWINGINVAHKVHQEGPLPEIEVINILQAILPVLDYFHSKEIVHLNIHPDNILLRSQDNVPVLLNFGSVKEAMGIAMTSSGGSAYSFAIGKPGFMPSEQAAGRAVFASDLYSLGLTAVFLLTGKIPQELATDPVTGKLLWHSHVKQINPKLVAIIDRAIQINLGDRYSSAKEMLNALGRISGNIPTINFPQPRVTTYPVKEQLHLPSVDEEVKTFASIKIKKWHKAIIIASLIGSFSAFLWSLSQINFPSQPTNQPQSFLRKADI